jgi:regulator of sigma E protease
MFSLLIFIIVIGIIIFVHELGHFIAAKSAGMRVDEFGFGFPPRIFGVNHRDTIYSLNWIPLGGFVKIKGENGEEAWESDSFAAKSMPRRILVILAGVTMNVILAFVLFTGGYIAGVPQAIDVLPEGAIISAATVQVGEVLAGSPASRGDLRSNDVIEKFNGQKVASAEALRSAIRASTGDVKIEVKRGKAEVDLTITPEVLKETGVRGLGVELIDVGTVRFPWYLAPVRGAEATAYLLWSIILSFYGLLAGLFAGQGLSPDVSGPIGIAVVTGQAVQIGFAYLVEFVALLSLNLAVINAVPFPALDGGRFLFLVIEAVRRRPVSRRVEGIVHQIGFALLMLLVVAVTYRDLVRYGSTITGFLKGIF